MGSAVKSGNIPSVLDSEVITELRNSRYSGIRWADPSGCHAEAQWDARLRSGRSTLDGSVRPFRRTTLQLQLRTQESTAALRLGRFLRRFCRLTGNLGARGKSFRAKRLYDVDAAGACRREHRSDYRRA